MKDKLNICMLGDGVIIGIQNMEVAAWEMSTGQNQLRSDGLWWS